MTDLIVIGGGPAGTTAAVYAKRSGLSVQVLEKASLGGQMSTTSRVDNLLPFGRTTGEAVCEEIGRQLAALDIPVESVNVSAIQKIADGFCLLAGQQQFTAKTVIWANGVTHRKLNCPGEDRFTGRGISWCATCDGNFFRGKTVAVCGGGNSAAEEALYLADLCRQVFLIHREDTLSAEQPMQEEIAVSPTIRFCHPFQIIEVGGEDKMNFIIMKNAKTGELKKIAVDGLFEAIGRIPDNQAVSKLVKLDDKGYILSDVNGHTATPGLFVAGDTRAKKMRQIITASADGAIAAAEAAAFLREQRHLKN